MENTTMKITLSDKLYYLLDNISALTKLLTDDSSIKILKNNKDEVVDEFEKVKDFLEDGEALADYFEATCSDHDIDEFDDSCKECQKGQDSVESLHDEVEKIIQKIC